MRTPHDTRLSAMRRELSRARELTELGDHSAAKAALLRLRQECSRQGVASAHVAWCLAAACDGLGEFPEALAFAREAVRIDPLAVPYHRSYEVIVERIREALSDEQRRADDPTTPALHELLLESDDGDARSHIAMARWHLHRDDPGSARQLLEAVVTLSPSVRDAWHLLARAARDMGDERRAQQAELEAAARDHAPLRARA